MKLTISGISMEQVENIVKALKTAYVTPTPDADIESRANGIGELDMSVTCHGHFAASQLASILLDEDSGADYLT